MKNKLVSVVIVTRNRKKDLIECINSYLESTYKKIEIIVVDNNSSVPVSNWLQKKFPTVNLLTSSKNLGAAGGRNLGLSHAEGEYILFTDDDAYADKGMVKNLVWVFEKDKNAGIVQPLIYDKDNENILQGAGHDINLMTGRIKAWGARELDEGQYEGLREVPMCGCVWMVRKKVFEKIGNYDEDYFIPYEDSDFSLRTRNSGYKLYCYSRAKAWHQGLKVTFVHPLVEWLGITNSERAFRVARNKIIFMSKHSTFPSSLYFFCFILPVYLLLHSLIIIATFKLNLLIRYWEGLLSGLNYLIRKIIERLKIIILAWTDPLPWVIDKNGKTILDLGCGEGLPARLIKERYKHFETVGIDLFEPYVQKARKLQTHNKYLLQDVRKLNFKNRSFDIVIASHVLEHLKKDEAWNLLSKMEKIASRQVIIAMPIGELYHPPVDGNKLQLHLSSLYPEEFKKRGYKVINYGWKFLMGNEGLMNKWKNIIFKELCLIIHLISTPIFYLLPNIGTYTFVAVKKVKKQKIK